MRRSITLLAGLTACGVPDAGHRSPAPTALDWKVGDWIGVRRDLQDDSTATMTLRVRRVLGGAGHVHEIEIERPGGGVYRGVAIEVFDPEGGVWRRSYVNDVSRTFARLDGVVDGARSEWRTADPTAGRQSRLVSERVDDGWRRTMFVRSSEDERERPLWRDELRRR